MRKERVKLVLLLLVTAIGLSSCQQETTKEENEICTRNKYLSVSENYLKNISYCPTDSNYVNFQEAANRIIGLKNGKVINKVPNAKEANVSPELYSFISDLIDPQKRPLTRTESDGKISTSENDCQACTMANIYCELISLYNYTARKHVHDDIWKYMTQNGYKEGLVDDKTGRAFENLLRKIFNYVLVQPSPEPIYTPTKDNPKGAKVIAVIRNAKGEYHSVTVTVCLEYGFACRDDQNNCPSYWNYTDVVYYIAVAEPKDDYKPELKMN